MSDAVLSHSSADTFAVSVTGIEAVAKPLILPCTHLPMKTGAVRGLPLLSTNWINMYGFPPTPPSTGCFGIVIVVPCGTAVVVEVEVYVWVPFTLFWKVNWADTALSPITPERVMYGPGLLVQSVAVAAIWIVTCSWVFVVTVCVAKAGATEYPTSASASTDAARCLFVIIDFTPNVIELYIL